jgi:hypothetical protein
MTIHADEEMDDDNLTISDVEQAIQNVPDTLFPYQKITMISGEKLEICLSRDDQFESFLSQYDIPYVIEMWIYRQFKDIF